MQTVLKVACFAMLVLQIFAKEEPCGRRPLTHLPLILGGENSVPGEWPWHAAIFLLKDEKSTPTYRCGGTLISSSFVLTAAHCTFISAIPLPPNLLSMKLGVTNLNIGGAEQKGYGVKLVVRHSKYNPWNHHYDVALLKTFNKVKFSDFIQPVCLPSKNHPFERGTVVGWGIGETNQMETILQKADLNFVDFSTCLKSDTVLFSVLLAADHSNYCAGNRNATNACYGDSGGGMFTNKDGTWYITGITSAGVRSTTSINKRCDPRQYVVFANVTDLSDWITSVRNKEQHNLLELEECGEDHHDPSVPESDKPIFQQYPWVTLLEYNVTSFRNIETVCGGVLIHPRFVLTTGHCVCETCANFKLKAVRLGDFDLSKDFEIGLDGEKIAAESISVMKIIHHPQFGLSGYGHNIAIIKLSRPVSKRMSNVQPICLPKSRASRANHFIVGWKRAGEPKVLHRETVQLQDIKQCIKVYNAIKIVLAPEDNFVCVKNTGKASDCFSFKSGSALQYQATSLGVNRYYLKGMFALGLPRCGSTTNDIFVDTLYHSDWIKNTIAQEIRLF